jgi:hypothetical protein
MKDVILPKFDYKEMERAIEKEWYTKYEGKGYTVALSINETVEQIGDRVQASLREKTNENLNFNIYMDEEGIIYYRLSFSIGGEGSWAISICSIEGKTYDDDYNFAKSYINKALNTLTVDNLKYCEEYAKFLVNNKEKYKLSISYGSSECINVDRDSVSVPGELIAYKNHSDIIKYFVRNTKRIIKRREKAIHGRYFFNSMEVQRSEVRKTISSIDYTEFAKVFKVC